MRQYYVVHTCMDRIYVFGHGHTANECVCAVDLLNLHHIQRLTERARDEEKIEIPNGINFSRSIRPFCSLDYLGFPYGMGQYNRQFDKSVCASVCVCDNVVNENSTCSHMHT